MKLKDHTSVENISELNIGEKRFILFNSVLYQADVCDIKSKECVAVRITYLNTPFEITIPINLIYRERPS